LETATSYLSNGRFNIKIGVVRENPIGFKNIGSRNKKEETIGKIKITVQKNGNRKGLMRIRPF